MKSILLQADMDRYFESRLQAALALVRYVGGHLSCLQTRSAPSFLGADAAGFVGSAAMVVQLMEGEARAAEEARAKLKERLDGEDVPFSFLEAMGEPRQTLVDNSPLMDAIVMTRPPEDQRNLLQALSAVVVNADSLVLAVPHDLSRIEFEKPIVLAWKSTLEAAHALQWSRPLLEKAPEVHIVTVEAAATDRFPATAAATYLSRYGVKASVHDLRKGTQSTSDVILQTAQGLGAGFIAMGGYGRSRAMEFLLGGVTRRLLTVSPVPLLLAH